ncbi:MAG TPA: ATP-binding protein [Aliidongia sp.]|uniref:ATP-binding protein n=1 Tax=Aliidongia sp. TaxID=1914230 RepID=UPI002DDD2338|nr:ATP-binding protein [Aliidongia sp.]HEV2674462.1 ATP-binding protein [Aliidongia sp.]
MTSSHPHFPPVSVSGELLATRPRTARQMVLAGALALLLMAFAAGVLPIADQRWPTAPGFLVIGQTLSALVYLLTAHLLVRHFLASRTLSLLWIAAGTLYAAAIQLLQLWSMPDLLISNLSPDRALLVAAWCWLLWHGGLPIAAIGFAWSDRSAPRAPCATNQTRILVWGMRATIAALVAISTVLIMTAPWVSPAIVRGGDYRAAVGAGVGPFLAIESLVTLVLLWRWTRVRTSLQLFFGLSILALMLDDLLTLAGGIRGTLGWHAGRLEALAAAGCLLGLCLGEVGRLYQRVAQATEGMMIAEWAFETEVARRIRPISQTLVEAERLRDVLAAEATSRADALIERTAERDELLCMLDRQAIELEALRTKAEVAGVAKTQFLSTMSHELRTPLTGIIGFSDLLLKTELSPSDQRRFLELQREAAQALLAVLGDVLDYANAEAGRLDLEIAPFAPRALVDAAAAVVRHGVQAKGLEFRIAVAPTVPAGLAGDATRIRQVLLNLLANAVKFTPTGSIELRIDYQARGDGPQLLCLQVIDTGIGVAADKLDRLFQQFSQVDGTNTRRYGGSGLGLAICRKLVDLMGGTLGVESEEGRGSLFWVELPLAVAAPPQVVDPNAARPPRRILLAEDVVANQILVAAILEASGHLVDVVDDGVAAVTALRRTAYDLVLMDVQMPVMNGIDATRAIRDDEGAARHTPIVALTANASAEDAARCLAAGMDAYVAKPIDEPHLLATIDRLTASESEGPVRPPVAVLDERTLDGLIGRIGLVKATELVGVFRRSVETEIAALGLARADATAARGHGKALAGLAGNLGCAELERAARRLGTLRDKADGDELDQHLAVLTEAARRALAALADRFPVDASVRVVPLPTRR